jgi:hypothetical protein
MKYLLLLTALAARPSGAVALNVLALGDRALDVLGCPPVACNEAGSTWIVDRADNICGLDDPKMLSKPAKVDYDALLEATPEMKKIKDDKIDPSSPLGIQLRQTAVTHVQAAVEKARAAGGYCSVWKAIRHKDGRIVPDITEAAKAQL